MASGGSRPGRQEISRHDRRLQASRAGGLPRGDPARQVAPGQAGRRSSQRRPGMAGGSRLGRQEVYPAVTPHCRWLQASRHEVFPAAIRHGRGLQAISRQEVFPAVTHHGRWLQARQAGGLPSSDPARQVASGRVSQFRYTKSFALKQNLAKQN